MPKLAKLVSVRTYVAALVLAIVVPVGLAAAFSVGRAVARYQREAGARLELAAASVSETVQNEVERTLKLTRALAQMHDHGAADLDVLRRAISESYAGVEAVAVVESGSDAFAKQSGVPAALIDRVIASGAAASSNLFAYGPRGEQRLAYLAPVEGRDGRAALIVVADPRALTTMLRRAGRNLGLLISVLDGEGRVVARSEGSDMIVGRRATDWDRLATIASDHALVETRTAEGYVGVFGFQRAARTPDWRIFVGESREMFTSRWLQPLAVLGAAMALATLLAIAGAVTLARRLTAPLRQLAAHAERVTQDVNGAEFEIAPSPVREFETLRRSLSLSERALRDAAQKHRQTAERLAESEIRYRALVHAGALVVWRATLKGEIVSADGWEALTGVAETAALGEAWRQAVRPEDKARLKFKGIDKAAPDFVLDAEFRIRGRDGGWRWVRGRGALVRDAKGAPVEWVGVLEDVDERRTSQERIAYLAHHDALTGLPNRVTFRERIALALDAPQQRARLAVLYLDLDRFKDVNDAFGHSAGDALLVQAAARLARLADAQTDVVARLGGDEFGVVCLADDPLAHAQALAERIVAALSAPFQIDHAAIAIGASVGVAAPESAQDDVEALLRNADMALYRAKDEGAGCWRVYQPALGTAAQARIALEQDLRCAVREGGFELFYQPLIALQNSTLIGFEALLRWRSPTRGMVSPADFIPVAEKTGLIVEIGEWVTREACRQAAGWPAHLGISVNVSPRQLSGGDFAAVARAALAESGLAAERLTLEITESALLEAAEATMATLLRLKAMGCKVAMDDFGTGYSSLGYLRSFQFDKVKIDRSFIKDSTDDAQCAAILRGILALCRSLRIPNTGEGIETEEQRDLLRALGCEEAQGFLFGRPVPKAEADEIVARMIGPERRLRLAAG